MEETRSLCLECGFPFPEFAPQELCPRCTVMSILGGGAESDSVDGFAPIIPGVQIHEEVGQGGFGIVYRATQTAVVKRQVALKVLKAGVDTREVLRRFEVEQQALAILDHPNIARIYEAGETAKGYPYFTMEFIAGVSITDAFAVGEVGPMMETFLQVSGAVEHAHSKGVIHRDLKPSNILVTLDGSPKVIDFGIAKATDSKSAPGMTHYTGISSWMGTPDYMAPEQEEGSSMAVDARTDLYALGAILYELMTGMTPVEAMANHRTLPRPSKIGKLPKGFDTVISRALAKDPNERYPSVKKFSDDLRLALVGKLKPRVGGFLKWGLVAALGIAVFTSVFVYIEKPEPPVKNARQRAWGEPLAVVQVAKGGRPWRLKVNQEGTRALVLCRDGGRSVMINPRTGKELFSIEPGYRGVYNGSFSQDGVGFLISYEDGTAREFLVEDGVARSSRWDLGGQKAGANVILETRLPNEGEERVLTAGLDAKFRMWDKSGGKVLWEESLVGSPWGADLSPDGSLLVLGSQAGEMTLLDLVKQTKKPLPGHIRNIDFIAFSPDGTRFASGSADGTCRVWKKDGSLERMIEHVADCRVVGFSPDNRLLVTACLDGGLRLWNAESGMLVHELKHDDEVLNFHFSPDGALLVSGGWGKKVRVWEVESGEPYCEPLVLPGQVRRVRFVPNGEGQINVVIFTLTRKVWTYLLPGK